MESEEYPIVILNGGKARKRKVSNTKRSREKLNRYKQKRPPIVPSCNHKKGAGTFQCNTINGRDAMYFSKLFYANSTKILQNSFLLTYASAVNPSRRGQNSSLKRTVSVVYYVRKANKNISRVCQVAFCGILGIKKDRVVRLAKRHLDTGFGPVDRRGGDRIGTRNQYKKDAVINFIRKFRTIEVHYCRSKIAKRQYLPSELNINKMFMLFISDPEIADLNIKKSYFRNIFNNSFNIGFKTPATDLCSTCIMLKERIKFETDSKRKQDLMVQSMVHKRRAKAFFGLAREEADDLLTMSFDCQKNMVLPKVADQAAYYSRQIYFYNFGIVVGSSKTPLSKECVFLYTWTENLFSKGSNQISSAVHHRLCNLNLNGKARVRLVADGCGGQNKNSIMIGMLCSWLLKEAPDNIKQVELVFPIPGHSYIPPDRVFAKLEKEVKVISTNAAKYSIIFKDDFLPFFKFQIRNKQTIIKPGEYIEIYNAHGTVIELGDVDCPVKDWKTEASIIIRPPSSWHFKFNEAKRFIISKISQKILVRGEVAYKSDIGASKSITKRGKYLARMNPNLIEPGIRISEAKLLDVNNLLRKHFGDSWAAMDELAFYNNIINSNDSSTLPDALQDPICEVSEEHQGVRI